MGRLSCWLRCTKFRILSTPQFNVMSEKKGYPTAPQAPAGYVPAPPHPAAAAAYAASAAPQQLAGSPYAVYQQLYPGQAPPPYDQQIPAIMAAQQQMYSHVGVGTPMYSQAASPAGYYASAFTPMQAYYHPLAYSYPQPQLRPAIMIPNGYDGGARRAPVRCTAGRYGRPQHHAHSEEKRLPHWLQ
ncbi:hypothetical protein GE061_002456 [Apolygus lucorum]|uniref:Deleted in azoospermia-associated protein 2 n=1 Tax=Apolygus lucorum TaxID=248454 RepID=A0A8S9X7S3_APOLU|nr:hypothetical protein GE061_002456 [Apolygus lucorum]